MRTLVLSLFAAVLCLLVPVPGRADDSKTFDVWRASADAVVELRTTLTKTTDGKMKATVKLQRLDAKLGDDGPAILVHEGGLAFPTVTVRPGAAAVLLLQRGAAPSVKVVLVDLATAKTKTVDLPRTAQKGFVPTSAVTCPDDDGFTLLWQEQNPLSPNDVQSTMARVKADGTILAKPSSVPVAWGLGAIVATSSGYTLAVRYDGSQPDQTRICFVTLSPDGTPQEHPWWGARPAQVGDIQLAVVGGNVVAAYRSESPTESILSVTVDKANGSWGKEAAESKVLAKDLDGAPFAVRAKDGALQLLH